MQVPTIQELVRVLRSAWSAETAFDAREWSAKNPARGQCVPSSLVVQDYFGGDLLRYDVHGANGLREKHYCNVLPGGTILDTTGMQYTESVTLRVDPVSLGSFADVRAKRLADATTRQRYELLKALVVAALQ